MKVSMPPVLPHHGRPETSVDTKAGKSQSPAQGNAAKPTVVVDISSAGPSTAGGPGKSAMSPAHQAKAMIANAGIETLGDAHVKLGQIVSALARGFDAASLLSPAVTEDPVADEAAVEETGIVVDESTDESTTAASDDETVVVVDEPVEEEGTVSVDESVTDESMVAEATDEIVVSDVDTDAMLLDELDAAATEQA